jgi:oligoendopeptidase F
MKRFAFTLSLAVALSCATAWAVGQYKPDSNATRASVPAAYKWNPSVLFKSDGAWNAACADVQGKLNIISSKKGKISAPVDLKSALDLYFDAKLIMSRISLYAMLKSTEDEDVERYQEMFKKSSQLSVDFNAKTSFIKQRILKMGSDEAGKIASDASFAAYVPYINELRRRSQRVLDDGAERILGLAGDNLFASSWPTSDIELIFKAALRDLKFPKIKDEDGKDVQLNLSAYTKYRASKDRAVRKGAVEAFLQVLRDYQNILATALAGEMKRDVMFAKARSYDRAVDAYLDIDDISPAVMDNLISTVNRNLGPLHRYVELRKKMLGLKDCHLYDLYTPIVKSVDTDIPYDEGAKFVAEALSPLGSDYTDIIKKATQPGSGWIDVYPNKGKESGAYSDAAWGIHPFIKLNYQDEVDDVSTLAHELGHTMHSYLNMNVQPFVTFGYSTFTAEIASTFNEKMLSDYLLGKYKDDDDMRLYILGEMLESIRTTIYRQTLFAEFERKLHEFAEKDTPMSAELLNKTYIDLIKRYYGPGFTIDKNDDIEWAFIPHFYYKYYVYAYATGLSSGITLAQAVENEGDKARDRYLGMLKEPITANPIEMLKKAGADLTKPAVIESALRLMDQIITDMEKIISKKKSA